MFAARGTGWLYHNSDPELKPAATDAQQVKDRVWREMLAGLEMEWLEEPYVNDLMVLMDMFGSPELDTHAEASLKNYPAFPNQPKTYGPIPQELATPKQVAFLRRLGYKGEIPTKTQASILIDDLKNNRMAA